MRGRARAAARATLSHRERVGAERRGEGTMAPDLLHFLHRKTPHPALRATFSRREKGARSRLFGLSQKSRMRREGQPPQERLS